MLENSRLANNSTSGSIAQSNATDGPNKPKQISAGSSSFEQTKSARTPLGAVKSLESNSTQSGNDVKTRSQLQAVGDETSSAHGGQQKQQMFSLKQLAINSRNLTKKRASINSQQQQAGQVSESISDTSSRQSRSSKSQTKDKPEPAFKTASSFSKFFESTSNSSPQQDSSSTHSSVESNSIDSAGSEPVTGQKIASAALRKRSDCRCQKSSSQQDQINYTDEDNDGQDDDFDDDDDDDYYYDSLDDDESCEDADRDDDEICCVGNEFNDENGVAGNDSCESGDEVNLERTSEKPEDSKNSCTGARLGINLLTRRKILAPGEKKSAISKGGSVKKVSEKATSKSRKRRQTVRRRSSCCNCEPMVTKVDHDGLLVTDVDLVTYKDLCQMEQQAHRMRTSHRPRRRLETGATGCHGGFGGFQQSSLRRSSLQEESGAYYQLCTSGDEQLIRQRYLWFPPSLKKLEQVDQFFASFSNDKIPFTQTAANLSSSSSAKNESNQHSQLQTVALKSPTLQSAAHRPASLTSGSYRDEQISFQLPRQDISLDYCSYPMSDSSRSAYSQFVDKRNTQALDVGYVVQISLNLAHNQSSSTSQVDANARASRHSGTQTPTPEQVIRQQRHRKASTVSQSAAVAAALNAVVQRRDNHNQQQQQQVTGAVTVQRCRRCLVRFEDKQLAVVAPNFKIGSAFYRPSVVSVNPSQTEAPTDRSGRDSKPQASGSTFCKAEESKSNKDCNDWAMSSSSTCFGGSLLSPPNNVALFHPNCFTCSTCKEFLVDLVYCLRDNKLYCLRHYGESLRPRCSWCQELIFSDEYLKAMNESFHVDHFLCRHCDSNLAGQRYVLKEEKPYCIQCYESNFANTCEDCQKPIGIDSRDLSYKDRHWHDTCFICNQCNQSLIDKPFGSKAEKVYCADCYDVTFATRCDGCKNPFRAGSKKMEYRGRQWHDGCFCCCVCQNTIGSNSFIPKNDEIYCIKCYEDKYATRCTKCKQVIVSGGVTFRNEPWHRDCFNCCNCNKSLAGQRFTTRDVKNETVKNTNKTNQPHNAYCIDCYGELFAKKCFACSQAITGLGGTRFVTFEDRSWHNDCFMCNDCNTSLVGKGFITDGPETILCGECARAKLR